MPLLRTRCWVFSFVLRQFPGASLLVQQVSWHHTSRSRFRYRRLFSCLPFLKSLRHGVCLSLERKWLRKNIDIFMMLNRRRRLHHSSRVKLPVVNKSASCFLVSTFLIWIFGSKLILSNNQSNATLWVLDTCLIIGLRPLMIILITASLSSKMYNRASHCEKKFRLLSRDLDLTTVQHSGYLFPIWS